MVSETRQAIEALRAVETERELTDSEERRLIGLLKCDHGDSTKIQLEAGEERADNYIQIGWLKIPLVLSRHGVHNKDFPLGNGIPSEFTARLPDDLGDTWKHGGLRVSITPVHQHSCPYWRMGKKHGPCNCGAEERFKRLLEEAGEPWFLPGFETTEKQLKQCCERKRKPSDTVPNPT